MSTGVLVAEAIAVHGLRVRVEGDWPEVIDELLLDWEWFRDRDDAGGRPEVVVEVRRRAPDYDAYGEVPATFVTPRNVVYQLGERTVVDYFGRAISTLDRATGRILVEGEDKHLVHEAAYLYLLSRIGEHLDALGLPRLHALGLAGAQGGVAVMLPSGGGKTTLALAAIRDPEARVLSEDSPLLDRGGRLHPFPLRIGVNATDAERLEGHEVRRIERMEFHPKLVLDLASFRDRIAAEPVPLRHVVIGRRSLGRAARLEAVPRRAAAGPLLRECVVGVGIYQGMEFVLQQGMRDTLRKGGTAALRARCCAAGLRGARVWRLTLGRDHARNWDALRPLLRAE